MLRDSSRHLMRSATKLALWILAGLGGALSLRAQELYVVDRNASLLNVYNAATGALLNSFATPANTQAVAVDASGNYYITYGSVPFATDYIAKYNSAGALVTSWGTGGTISATGGASGFPGVAIDPSGTSLAVPISNSVVNVYSTATGGLLSTSTLVNSPMAIAYNTSGTNFFVSGYSTVEQFPAAGGTSTAVTGVTGFIQLQGLYFQSDTSFLAVGDGLGELRRYTYNPGTNTATLDTTFNGGLGYVSVSSPFGVTTDANGNIFVSSFNGNTISEYSSAGVLINGSFITGLNFPEGIAFTPVPEPSTEALLLLGTVVIGVHQFRRRRA